jgi:hypothetical protein
MMRVAFKQSGANKDKGAKPDQKVLVAEPTTNATPRQIVQKRCPTLLNALSGD